jgi:hypothetical protein
MAIAVFHPGVAGERTLAAGSVPVACRRLLNSIPRDTSGHFVADAGCGPAIRDGLLRSNSVATGLLSLHRFLATEVTSAYIVGGYALRSND